MGRRIVCRQCEIALLTCKPLHRDGRKAAPLRAGSSSVNKWSGRAITGCIALSMPPNPSASLLVFQLSCRFARSAFPCVSVCVWNQHTQPVPTSTSITEKWAGRFVTHATTGWDGEWSTYGALEAPPKETMTSRRREAR